MFVGTAEGRGHTLRRWRRFVLERDQLRGLCNIRLSSPCSVRSGLGRDRGLREAGSRQTIRGKGREEEKDEKDEESKSSNNER